MSPKPKRAAKPPAKSAAKSSSGKRGRTGRPRTPIDPEKAKLVCNTIRAGNAIDTAFDVARVPRATARMWMIYGRQEKQGQYRDFLEDIRKAVADKEAFHVANIHGVARGKQATEKRTETTLPDGTKQVTIERTGGMVPQWTASAWMLERMKPDRWGRRDTMRHEGGDPGRPVVFEMVFDKPLPPSTAVSDDEDVGVKANGNGTNGNGRHG